MSKEPVAGPTSAAPDAPAPSPGTPGTPSRAEDGEGGPEGPAEAESDGAEEESDEEDEVEGEEGGSRLVENVRTAERRRGTEVKLLGLRLGEGTATVVATRVTVSLKCTRWVGCVNAQPFPTHTQKL